MHDDLRAAVAADMPRLKDLLSDLIRMESVSHHGFDPTDVRRAGEAIVKILDESGFANAHLLESSNGRPAVYAEKMVGGDAPTLLLYAHYDVQPPGPIEAWETGPFEPFEKDGRIYGRGASDDKAGVVMHLGAIAAHGDDLPVNIQIFFEGEEEAGSGGLPEILERNSDLLAPDIIVIGDGGHWEVGVPALLTSLRGIAAVDFELRVLQGPVHSGVYGGPIPDALTAMSRLLASLHDEEGNVAIAGLHSEETEGGPDFTEDRFRRESGAIEGLELIGSGSIVSRLYTKPAVSVLAIDAPPVAEAINAVVPVAAAKVSMRIPPGQDSQAALAALKKHLEENVPWGAAIEFSHEEAGEATTLDLDNDAVRAWKEAFMEAFGTDTVEMGMGGSIPFISTFKELYPEAPILVLGPGSPSSSIHAPNENQDVGDLERTTLAEAIAFRLLTRS